MELRALRKLRPLLLTCLSFATVANLQL